MRPSARWCWRGAGRAAGAGLGHVHLVDLVETSRGVRRQHAREARTESGAHHHRHPSLAGFDVEIEQAPHVGEIVAHGNDVLVAGEEGARLAQMRAGRAGQDHDVGIERIGVAPGVGLRVDAERLGHRVAAAHAVVAHHDRHDIRRGHELAGQAGTHGARADHGRLHGHQTVSGRTVTTARDRRARANRPPGAAFRPCPATAAPRRAARRSPRRPKPSGSSSSGHQTFRASWPAWPERPQWSGDLVGLARIELATSSLSGMRSNRLSYSPVPDRER